MFYLVETCPNHGLEDKMFIINFSGVTGLRNWRTQGMRSFLLKFSILPSKKKKFKKNKEKWMGYMRSLFLEIFLRKSLKKKEMKKKLIARTGSSSIFFFFPFVSSIFLSFELNKLSLLSQLFLFSTFFFFFLSTSICNNLASCARKTKKN